MKPKTAPKTFLYETKDGRRIKTPPETILRDGRGGHLWWKDGQLVPVRLISKPYVGEPS
jgi:hypothetical protein